MKPKDMILDDINEEQTLKALWQYRLAGILRLFLMAVLGCFLIISIYYTDDCIALIFQSSEVRTALEGFDSLFLFISSFLLLNIIYFIPQAIAELKHKSKKRIYQKRDGRVQARIFSILSVVLLMAFLSVALKKTETTASSFTVTAFILSIIFVLLYILVFDLKYSNFKLFPKEDF